MQLEFIHCFNRNFDKQEKEITGQAQRQTANLVDDIA